MPHRSRSDALETPGPKNKAGAAVSGRPLLLHPLSRMALWRGKLIKEPTKGS